MPVMASTTQFGLKVVHVMIYMLIVSDVCHSLAGKCSCMVTSTNNDVTSTRTELPLAL